MPSTYLTPVKHELCLQSGFLLSLLPADPAEVVCSSETSVHFHRDTRRYIPDEPGCEGVGLIQF
jgi:hypothetical protein